jgi:diguanylate cyclase (GGDEF)-like protein/PAS domain S-box-containing protein
MSEIAPHEVHPASIALRSIIEAMTEGVVIWSADGQLVDSNAAARKILSETLGLTLRQALDGPLPHNWLRLDEHGRPLPDDLRPIQRLVGPGTDLKDLVVGLQKGDGRRVWLSISARPILLPDGIAHGAVTTCRDITEQRQAEQDLKRRELEFRTLAEHSPDWIARVDIHGCYLYVNSLAEQFSGVPASRYIGRRIGEAPVGKGLGVDAEGLARMREGVSNAVRTGEKQHCTVTLSKGTVTRIYECRLIPEKASSGEVVSVLCVARNITELKRNESVQQSLNRSLRLLSKCNQLLIDARDEATLLAQVCRLMVESGGYRSAAVYVANLDPERSVSRIAGCASAGSLLEVAGLSWREGVPEASAPLMETLRTGVSTISQDCSLDPRLRPWSEFLCSLGRRSVAALPLQDIHGLRSALVISSNEPERFVSDELALMRELVDDLSFGLRTLHTRREHRAAEQQLAFLARHDPLTRLPNRLLLRERFEQALARAREQRERVAMLFADLDSFKEINDSLGHESGDKLLLAVAERLRHCLGPHDIVSREGGDEFLLLLTGFTDQSVVADVAKRILDALEAPFYIGENALHTTASIGVSFFPDDGEDFEELRRNSDTALFRAKDSGRNTFHFFDPQMNVDALERVHLQANLRRALQQNEFRLHYQPQVRASDGQILGVEALIRWQQPGGALIAPEQFIPAAERSGLIVPIGEWVLKEACRQAMVWRTSELPELVIGVNLSVAQFARGNIVESVTTALRESGLPPTALELELTESVMLRDTEGTLQTMQALKSIGVRLAIDDFGTGFSNLAYVKRLSVDRLKIAHNFVKEMIQNPQDAAIVRAIIQLANSLRLEVIAEGVETAAQLALLRSYGCDQIQGFLACEPLPPEQLLPYPAACRLRVAARADEDEQADAEFAQPLTRRQRLRMRHP